MTPAAVVVDVFKGINQVAIALGVHYNYVWRWTQEHRVKGDGKTSGKIPADYHLPLLEAAEKLGLHLTPEHLIYGKPAVARTVLRREATWLDMVM